jgi:hypothetical protein
VLVIIVVVIVEFVQLFDNHCWYLHSSIEIRQSSINRIATLLQ